SGPAPLIAVQVPPGGTCGRGPCWKAVGKPSQVGWKYTDPKGLHGGVTALTAHSGAPGRAQISLKAKGAGLGLAQFGILPTPVTVQLRVSSGGCFQATYAPAGVSRNSGGVFVAKGN